MIEYIFLILVPFAFSFVSFKSENNIGKKIRIGTSEYIKKNNAALTLFFVLYFLLLSLKSIDIGNDTLNYKYYFDLYDANSYTIIRRVGLDYLYGFFCWIFNKVSNDFQLFLSNCI